MVELLVDYLDDEKDHTMADRSVDHWDNNWADCSVQLSVDRSVENSAHRSAVSTAGCWDSLLLAQSDSTSAELMGTPMAAQKDRCSVE